MNEYKKVIRNIPNQYYNYKLQILSKLKKRLGMLDISLITYIYMCIISNN
jgi:hypothetical protein